MALVRTDPLKRRVALKILKGAYASNKKILNRTRDEARLLSRINHPNVVKVERMMEVAGRPVVVMEHVQGPSLDQLLLRFKDGLPAAVSIEIIRLTFLALHVAYTEALGEDGRPMRVIHRDIKPSNILLSVHGEVKVVDFGIAKGDFDGREAETESVVMGSRPYMAPERLDGISDSPSVDVYSAGMSLFELLTGRTMNLSINPINHDQAMNRQLGYIQAPGMSQAAVEDLRNLIRRMCAYTRDYRPTAIECARDLEQLIYAIDPGVRIGLDEFARTTVVPIYEARQRITPDDANGDFDDEFLREVTGALSGPITGGTGGGRPLMQFTPYIFMGFLSFLVVFLVIVAVMKVVIGQVGPPDAVAADNPVAADGKVRVKVWIPSDAQAYVGDAFVAEPQRVWVEPGSNLMQLLFDDGRQFNCPFDAAEGTSVRHVVDAGQHGLSVDDGRGEPCTEVPRSAP